MRSRPEIEAEIPRYRGTPEQMILAHVGLACELLLDIREAFQPKTLVVQTDGAMIRDLFRDPLARPAKAKQEAEQEAADRVLGHLVRNLPPGSALHSKGKIFRCLIRTDGGAEIEAEYATPEDAIRVATDAFREWLEERRKGV